MKSQNAAFGAICCALSVVLLFISSVFGTMKIAALFLSTVLMCLNLQNCGTKTALVSYIATTLVLFILIPDKTVVFLYFVFFGNYAFFKEITEKRENTSAKILLKALCAIIYTLLIYFFIGKIMPSSLKINLFLFFGCAVVVFMLGDFILCRVMDEIYKRLPFRSDEKWR